MLAFISIVSVYQIARRHSTGSLFSIRRRQTIAVYLFLILTEFIIINHVIMQTNKIMRSTFKLDSMQNVFLFQYVSKVHLTNLIPGYQETSMEKKLIRTLLEEYEARGKMGRPIIQQNDTLTVWYGLSLIQILDLDERNQVLGTNVWASFVSTCTYSACFLGIPIC